MEACGARRPDPPRVTRLAGLDGERASALSYPLARWTTFGPRRLPFPQLPEPELAPELTEVPWRAREAFLIVLLALVTGGFFTMLAVTATEDETLAALMATLLIEASLGDWVYLWVKLRHRAGAAQLGLRSEAGGRRERGACRADRSRSRARSSRRSSSRSPNRSSTGPVETPQQLPDIQHGTELFLAGIAVVIVAPIAEELFFRGFLYPGVPALARADAGDVHLGVRVLAGAHQPGDHAVDLRARRDPGVPVREARTRSWRRSQRTWPTT